MKIAFVNPPLQQVEPPGLSSVGIWSYEVARRLGPEHEVAIYGSVGGFRKVVSGNAWIEFRRMPIGVSGKLVGLMERLDRFRPRRRPIFASMGYYAGYMLRAARDIRAWQPAVVHVHDFSQCASMIRFFNPDVRIVLQMHNEWLTQLDPRLVARRLRSVNLVLGCSGHVRKTIREGFPALGDRCRTAFNGVDLVKFAPDGIDPGRNGHDPCILFVGRISPEKGVHVLIEAFQSLSTRFPRAQLVLAGATRSMPFDRIVRLTRDKTVASLAAHYGPEVDHYHRRLSERVAALGLERRVRFVGEVPYEDIAGMYRAADIVINPSFSEAFGRSLIEAMASARPVVATRVGGMTEIIEDGKTGLLVEPDDPRSLAGAMACLLENGDLSRSMGQAGRARAEEMYSWDAVVRGLVRDYESIR
jgi:glycosyltransferase involved in cell wall biosynthesis